MHTFRLLRLCLLLIFVSLINACAGTVPAPATTVSVAVTDGLPITTPPTDVLPPATEVPPTEATVPVTSTDVSPTATEVPATATEAPPTAAEAATATGVPTLTEALPTATRVPAKDEAATVTDVPTLTKAPPTATRVPATATSRPATRVPTAAAAQMPEVFADSFDAPGILKAGDSDICKLSYEGGQFHIRVLKQNYICWALYPREYTNLALDVDVIMHSGEGSCGGGASIVFGYKDKDNFSMLDVDRTCRSYHVGKKLGGEWQTLRKWDSGLRVGDSPAEGVTVTTLRLVVQGNQIELYSNGELMDKIEDPNYQGGRVGVAGGTWGQDTHVSFDNFRVQP